MSSERPQYPRGVWRWAAGASLGELVATMAAAKSAASGKASERDVKNLRTVFDACAEELASKCWQKEGEG